MEDNTRPAGIDIRDCTITTPTHSLSVQSDPPLIIATNKETGIEDHHSGEDAITLWDKVKQFADSVNQGLENLAGQASADADKDVEETDKEEA